MIQPTYITFEQSKLLKEKGFNEHCTSYYTENNDLYEDVGNYNNEDVDKELVHYSRPEQHIVVEWLRINHDIWVTVLPIDHKMKNWYFELLYCKNNSLFCMNDSTEFNSPQEAYSAAFDYVLNNLI